MAKLFHLPVVDSTNTYAKTHIEDLEDRTAVWADRQTGGKGRLGRSWSSPVGNLYLSMVFQNPRCDISLFPLLCAVAVSRAVKAQTGANPLIKWPNDLVLNGKKICGILCESVISSGKIQVVCGMGVNLNLGKESYSAQQLPYATSLKIETGRDYSIEAFAYAVSRELERTVDIYLEKGFSVFREEYESILVNRGKTVKVVYENQTIEATALGIVENGNLLCRKEDGSLLRINSGEASVRGLYGYV